MVELQRIILLQKCQITDAPLYNVYIHHFYMHVDTWKRWNSMLKCLLYPTDTALLIATVNVSVL